MSPVLSPTTTDAQSCAQVSPVLSPVFLSVQGECQAQEYPIPACLARLRGAPQPHPCLPGCTCAHTRAREPPVIPLTSALPHRSTKHGNSPVPRPVKCGLHTFPQGGTTSQPSPRIPSTRGVWKEENTKARPELAGWRRGKSHIHGHRGGKEPASRGDENPSLAALPTFKGGFSCSPSLWKQNTALRRRTKPPRVPSLLRHLLPAGGSSPGCRL